MKLRIAVFFILVFIPINMQPAQRQKSNIDNPLYWCNVGHFNKDQSLFVQQLASMLQPNFVLETGFCTGRSAISILSVCEPKLFISIDINLDYIKPQGRIYAALLQEKFPNFFVIEEDSKKIFTKDFFVRFFNQGIDWFTVDGDHSYAGCLSDLVKASEYLNYEGIIIIDDYKSGPPNGCKLVAVTNAVNDFCKKYKEFLKLEWNVRGKGFAILTKSKKTYDKISVIIK